MKKISKSERKFILSIVLFLLLLTSPFWIWKITPKQTLNVLIVDKTVTKPSFREHKGLTWVLNNEKYVKENGSMYSVSTDYREHIPNVQRNTEKNEYDVIYLSDQYGVHGDEGVPKNEEGNTGGLTVEDIAALEARLHSNATVNS